MSVLPPFAVPAINRVLPPLLWLLAISVPVASVLHAARPLPASPPHLPAAQGSATPPAAWPQQPLFHRQHRATQGDQAQADGWTLHGVQTGPARPSAILADASGQQASYALGQALPGGWTLQAVSAQGASLQGPDGLLQLQLPATTGALSLPPPAAAPMAVADSHADTTDAGQGLRLQAGSPAAHWLQRHGLRPGDALLSLDGQPLHGLSPQQLAGRLQGRASASLLWQRDGQTHTTVLRMP